MLDKARWWYSEIALLHALSLWSLDPQFGPRREELIEPIGHRVDDRYHPFVREAAQLCLRIKEDPSPYLWIDETGTIAHVGPSSGVSNIDSSSGLWLPPAAGWLTLDSRAQQLLADLVLMLNLVERGSFEGREERRLGTVLAPAPDRSKPVALHHGLPHCLTEPGQRFRFAVDARDEVRPGCLVEVCRANLCPYPAKEERPFRGELSEGFCRRQQSLLKRPHASRPAWQRQVSRWQTRAKRAELKQFWKDLEGRGGVQ